MPGVAQMAQPGSGAGAAARAACRAPRCPGGALRGVQAVAELWQAGWLLCSSLAGKAACSGSVEPEVSAHGSLRFAWRCESALWVRNQSKQRKMECCPWERLCWDIEAL